MALCDALLLEMCKFVPGWCVTTEKLKRSAVVNVISLRTVTPRHVNRLIVHKNRRASHTQSGMCLGRKPS